MKIKKGDKVKVLYGKDSGKTGKVIAVIRSKNMVIVEGVNMFKKHIKGDGQTKKSEVVNITKPMPVAKVMYIDPETNKPTRLGLKRVGKKVVRVSKRSGKEVVAEVEEKKEVSVKKKKITKKKETKK